MSVLRSVVESFIRLVKTELHSGAVLVASDDAFEVPKVPSVVIQGPVLTEDGGRRTPAMLTRRDEVNLSFEGCRHPRLYHLDFDIVVTTGLESELLEMLEKVARFYQLHPALSLGEQSALHLTELVPLGGLKRVNLSNMRQASGKCRIEDCPVYDGLVISGKLATGVKIETSL